MRPRPDRSLKGKATPTSPACRRIPAEFGVARARWKMAGPSKLHWIWKVIFIPNQVGWIFASSRPLTGVQTGNDRIQLGRRPHSRQDHLAGSVSALGKFNPNANLTGCSRFARRLLLPVHARPTARVPNDLSNVEHDALEISGRATCNQPKYQSEK